MSRPILTLRQAHRRIRLLEARNIRLTHELDECAGDYDFAEWLLGLVICEHGPDHLDRLVEAHQARHERTDT